MQILSVSSKYKFFTPNTLAVGATATALPAPSPTLISKNTPVPPEVILIQASVTNTKTVFLGNATVTATASAGIELTPGASYELPTRDYSKWFAIAADTNQKLQVLYLCGEI